MLRGVGADVRVSGETLVSRRLLTLALWCREKKKWRDQEYCCRACGEPRAARVVLLRPMIVNQWKELQMVQIGGISHSARVLVQRSLQRPSNPLKRGPAWAFLAGQRDQDTSVPTVSTSFVRLSW